MSHDAVVGTWPLGFQWGTPDPFLFCVHHDDAYPAGNANLGPAASLAGRDIGQDFAGKDGWRMYHGDVVPGFPHHPHRGFETVTIVRHGYIDHSDSLGATARFGMGDVQWLTAGRGILHSEMFPLLDREGPNRVELFQIWLNLPASDKMVDPYFSMFWSKDIPAHVTQDAAGRETTVMVVAGNLDGVQALPPPPNSWAARAESDVAIWTLTMAPGANFTLPPAKPGANRVLYFFEGESIRLGDREIPAGQAIVLKPDAEVLITNGEGKSEFLLLQGRAIGEPVAQHGPFVMNTEAEIRQAFMDYQRTQFGGWPWPSAGPVHPREAGKFARHADGKVEEIAYPAPKG